MQTITQANDITFTAGSGSRAYAQLGHGGAFSDGNHSGDQTIGLANNITFVTGKEDYSYAQVGHGGPIADGNQSGTIDITTAGHLTLTGQNTIYQYALIGHGDELGEIDSGEAVAGDIFLRIGGDINLTNAFIGHLIDMDGSYTSGNTFIGTNSLTTDANSQFFSAPTGELRFYVNVPNDNVNPATLLKGTPHGPTIFLNNQGLYSFGLGPYVPAAGTNFAYYATLSPILEATLDSFQEDTLIYDEFIRYQDYFQSVIPFIHDLGTLGLYGNNPYSLNMPAGFEFNQGDDMLPPGWIPQLFNSSVE